MAFDSFSAFIAMEGHGPYVWACYAVFFVLMAALVFGSVRSRNQVIESCRRGYAGQGERKPEAGAAPAASFARVNVSQD